MRVFYYLGLILGLITSVHAEQTIIVNSGPQQTAIVELYTSEGCSSCPPADRWLSELVDASSELNVLPLSFHVDYWDYIGWKDRFASPQYTQRQRHLARKNSMNTIYTPGFFVNGKEARGTRNLLSQINDITQQDANIDLRLVINRSQQDIELLLEQDNTKQPSVSGLNVQFIVFEDQLSSEVKRGENAGRQLHHQHVVRYLSKPQSLQQTLTHNIHKPENWSGRNLGVAAWITRLNGEFVQVIQSPIGDLFQDS